MADPTEPRALTAALAAPTFVTKGGGTAMHAATRHVERWAPEAGADRVRPLRNLGFVDRLVAPWLEAAQRSTSLRLLAQVRTAGLPERPTSQTSWLFPRPWYQDELDWMAAARQTSAEQSAPGVLTTRGTFVGPSSTVAMPAALHEYIAPSLSIAMPLPADATSAALSPRAIRGEAYSSLVPLAAVHAAQLMQRAVAPIAAARMSPGLRAVLATMLARTAAESAPTRLAGVAPELVTPPAPRAPTAGDADAVGAVGRDADPAGHEVGRVVAELGAQRAQLATLQQAARTAAERELAARVAAAAPVPAGERGRDADLEARIAERVAARQQEQLDARRAVAERAQERGAAAQREQRLHDAARESAARDVRRALSERAVAGSPVVAGADSPTRATPPLPAELVHAMAALSPALAATIATRLARDPERAAQTIGELGDALRAVELLARTSAAGGSFESTRGPRLVLPAGLGGLVATVARSMPGTAALAPTDVAAPRRGLAPRVPAVTWLAPHGSTGAGALGAAEAAKPTALQHVAWADRWLARFSGARAQSLDVLAATSASSAETRLQALAAAAPDGIFVAPQLADRDDAAAPAPLEVPVTRYDDNAETPDDMFASIAAAARVARTTRAKPKRAEAIEPARAGIDRETFADVVAHAAPAAPTSGLSAQLASSPFAPALRHLLPLAAAPTFDVRALFGDGLAAAYLAGLLAPASRELAVGGGMLAREALDWQPSYVAPSEPLADAAAADAAESQLTTMRSALLAVDVDALAAARAGAPGTAASAAGPTVARAMARAMALPLVGELAAVTDALGTIDAAGVARPGVSYAAPGMIADRAHAWSVAQERSASDLAFDFVTPELVLAARVYGLGPAAAAQAARLAIAGPGQLATMASAVDRTFVQALAIEAERRERVQPVTAYPRLDDAASSAAPLATSASTFGVARRPPRGAFMWPQATVAALGLSAAAPDGEQSMSVAALELLAARTVAELGTYAALAPEWAPSRASPAATAAIAAGEPSDADVLATATAMVPSARRAKFDAMYVALGQSHVARGWSPAARAARALALAGRGDEAITAHERAAIAWEVLPVVAPDLAAGDVDAHELAPGAARSTGAAALREQQRRIALPDYVEMRPGLAALSARAGEALGSYVAPTVAAAAPAHGGTSGSSSGREAGAVRRAPTAAQEMVRTGRPTGRFGGGEVEIPTWFEAAARKMFDDRSGGPASELSLAELTLITSAPPSQVAASTRGMPSGVPGNPNPSSQAALANSAQPIDIEKVANEVYRQILVLMDAARFRNGEPYL